MPSVHPVPVLSSESIRPAGLDAGPTDKEAREGVVEKRDPRGTNLGRRERVMFGALGCVVM